MTANPNPRAAARTYLATRRLLNTLAVLMTVLSILAAVLFQLTAFRERRFTDINRQLLTDRQLAEARQRLNEAIDAKLRNIPPTSSEYAHFTAEIEQLKADLRSVSDATLAVRQALNPTNPNDLLTIARLRDKVVDIERRFDRLEADLDKKYAAFTTSTLREISASSAATSALILAAIPLLLTFTYNIWRNYRPQHRTPPPSE